LGADTDVIVADYAATAANLTGIFHRLGILRPLADASAGNAESVLGADHPMLGAVAESMEIMLAELGAAAGMTSHLLDHGLEGDELVRLRAKLVA
ncbi:MAG TPA: tyrosine-protein phosphatase, partial [Actinomycetaceae bacterium]|nr:tyrosine-protein phosphatase [Actinomycetaceae bacterium]